MHGDSLIIFPQNFFSKHFQTDIRSCQLHVYISEIISDYLESVKCFRSPNTWPEVTTTFHIMVIHGCLDNLLAHVSTAWLVCHKFAMGFKCSYMVCCVFDQADSDSLSGSSLKQTMIVNKRTTYFHSPQSLCGLICNTWCLTLSGDQPGEQWKRKCHHQVSYCYKNLNNKHWCYRW